MNPVTTPRQARNGGVTSPRGRASALAIVSAALLFASACGDDSDEDQAEQAIADARYCQLASELELTAIAFGVASAPGEYAAGTPEAAASLVDQLGASLDELETAAPGDIRGEVEDLVAAIRLAADGDTSGLSDPDLAEASQEINAFRAVTCPVGSEAEAG